MSIVAAGDDQWRRLCRAMGQPSLASDPRFATASDRKAHEGELEAIITDWTQSLDPWEATRRLQEAGVAAFPPLDSRELGEDPHLAQRGFFVELEHPEVGVRRHAGIPWRMSATACRVERPAPLLGQDNDYVLRDLLGYSDEEIEQLKRQGILV